MGREVPGHVALILVAIEYRLGCWRQHVQLGAKRVTISGQQPGVDGALGAKIGVEHAEAVAVAVSGPGREGFVDEVMVRESAGDDIEIG